jgi:hypothetical protein
MNWSKKDPREHITKRSRIVVLPPGKHPMLGEVEVKNGYCVFLYPEDKDSRRFVAEDESWPDWFWVNSPYQN